MRTPKEKLGSWLVGIAVAITLMGDAFVIFLEISRSGFSGSSIVRWVITAALFYAIWRGHRWARWLVVGLIALGLMLLLPATFSSFHPLLICMVLQFGIALGLLAFPSSVTAFQSYQRTRNAGNA